jgi:hypothetical protein
MDPGGVRSGHCRAARFPIADLHSPYAIQTLIPANLFCLVGYVLGARGELPTAVDQVGHRGGGAISRIGSARMIAGAIPRTSVGSSQE